jgi:ATP-dependent 26S proteasome regulatory subunit
MTYYTTSHHHILAMLERIDLLIQTRVRRLRAHQGADELFQGIYISEQELDALLARPIGLPHWATGSVTPVASEEQRALAQLEDEIARREAESRQHGVELRLARLVQLFHLTPLERDVILICLAPELDLRYERLYAYLQDDVTKKRPSIDLVLNLLSPSFDAKVTARKHFSSSAPLIKHHLLQLLADPAHPQPPLLNTFLKLDERVVNYLLDGDEVDQRLAHCARLIVPDTQLETLVLPGEIKERLRLLVCNHQDAGRLPLLYFQGSAGVGKEATAAALSRALDLNLLVISGEEPFLQNEGLQFSQLLYIISREVLLQNAVLYWSGFDSLLQRDRQTWHQAILRMLNERQLIAILGGSASWEPTAFPFASPFIRVEFPDPTYAERVQLWAQSLSQATLANSSLSDESAASRFDLPALASKFRLTGGQIWDAVQTACNLARWRDPEHGQVTQEDLQIACRLHSNRKLAELAQKITPHYGWDDIVLPRDPIQQLQEVCNHVRYRGVVYDSWGFDHKLSLGKGLNVLFVGPSGTGKTMAAEIIAGDLGLDLYKIDLAAVVSKYIGETEKNLSRIFSEAESSNAILFFDEADALFGKRSEVRDAHDRYANVEISYLLQRMEEYEGIVILATNLRKNMDDAFVRRMHFTVEFPFPGEKDRRTIWEKIWPPETPRSADLDFDFMARRFELAGGNIRNIALAAAFLAAADRGVVDMIHLIRATQREYQKMGKVVLEEEFGAYAGLVRRRNG